MAPPCWLVITRPAWRSWFNASADRLARVRMIYASAPNTNFVSSTQGPAPAFTGAIRAAMTGSRFDSCGGGASAGGGRGGGGDAIVRDLIRGANMLPPPPPQ